MRKITIRCLLTIFILFCLRFAYINVAKVPFFEQVFISTSIALISVQVIAEVALNKRLGNKK